MVEGEQRHGGVDHRHGPGDHAAAPAEAGEPVPLTGVVALAALRLVPGSGPGQALADIVPPDRQRGVIRRPIIRAEQAHAPARQALEQAIKGGLVALTAFPVDQPAGAALERLPDPELGGFFLMKRQTSSSSTTAVLPVGSGLGQWRCA